MRSTKPAALAAALAIALTGCNNPTAGDTDKPSATQKADPLAVLGHESEWNTITPTVSQLAKNGWGDDVDAAVTVATQMMTRYGYSALAAREHQTNPTVALDASQFMTESCRQDWERHLRQRPKTTGNTNEEIRDDIDTLVFSDALEGTTTYTWPTTGPGVRNTRLTTIEVDVAPDNRLRVHIEATGEFVALKNGAPGAFHVDRRIDFALAHTHGTWLVDGWTGHLDKNTFIPDETPGAN